MEVGTRLSAQLTVLGAIKDGRDPVYIVWHHGAWCPMACKIIRTPAKLQREADILAALAHPNIVRCLGTDGSRHLLMEFLEGPTLNQARRERPDGWCGISDAMRVAIYLGAALQHVHQRGFLHMDVKGSNVILAHGRPVLFDFGVARSQDEPRPASYAGTHPYMAPEECLCQPVTPTADVFGLGVTIYKLLTGQLPFRQETAQDLHPQLLGRQRRAVHRADVQHAGLPVGQLAPGLPGPRLLSDPLRILLQRRRHQEAFALCVFGRRRERVPACREGVKCGTCTQGEEK